MKYRRLGRSDLEVSTVCMGCWTLIGDATWGPQDEADSRAAVEAALEAGVNFFDTAELYGGGESEVVLGKALGRRRDKVIVASKVASGNLAPDDLKAACEASLRRLGRDYLDLYQVHWPSPDRPIEETLAALDDLRREGKVRVIGVSNFGASYLRELLAVGRVESNQVCYSLLWRPVERDIQPICVAQDISILCYSPLCQGLLTGKFASADEVPEGRARTRLFSKDRPQSRHHEPGCEAAMFEALAVIRAICDEAGVAMNVASLAWLLAQPGVVSVVTGMRDAAQAAANARAGDVELAPEVVARLRDATEPIQRYAGANADLWQSDSRMERPV